MRRGLLKDYYELAKPGLVYGNLIPVIAGFLMGDAYQAIGFQFIELIGVLVGIALVMASGCVFNKVIDAVIDVRMKRTKNRPIVAGRISRRAGYLYGIVLGLVGFALLGYFSNAVAAYVGVIGWLVYVIFYSLWAKRSGTYGALVGSIAGAVPPVVGYAAAVGYLDLGAFLLFLILIVWQMPHFYSIGIYRVDDYRAADIPTLPARQGITRTKYSIVGYIWAFLIIAPLLAVFGYAGVIYGITVVALGFVWLVVCLYGFRRGVNAKRWARAMFFVSLAVMVGTFLALAVDSIVRIA